MWAIQNMESGKRTVQETASGHGMENMPCFLPSFFPDHTIILIIHGTAGTVITGTTVHILGKIKKDHRNLAPVVLL